MKKHSLAIAAILLAGNAITTHAQSVGIGLINPDASAKLDVSATNKGILIPRVALQSVTDAATIPTPATSLLVYNTNAAMPTKQGYYYNSGTTTAPRWQRLAGVDGGTAPATGQTIIWNGTTYITGNPAITTSNPVFSGDGTPSNPLNINTAAAVYNANLIQGKGVSTTAPTNGQTLVFDAASGTYIPGTTGITTGSPNFSGNGTTTSPLLFTGVSTAAPVTGNGTTASPLSVNSTLPIYNANNLQGKAISTTAPTTNQVLVFNGTSYVPGPVNASQILGSTINTTTPTNGQVLLYNSTTNQYVPSAVPGDNWGTQVAVTSGAAITGNGTTASPIMVNNNSPIFNADKLNSTNITGTPTTGQSIVYNGTSYAPGNPSISTGGTSFTGNGTPGSPLTFGGVVASSPLSGSGTTASPLTINTTLPLYNANSLQGKAISTTAPTTNQVLVYNGTNYVPGVVNAVQIQGNTVSNTAPVNGQSLVYNSTTNQYVPTPVLTSASNGLVTVGSDVRLGGSLTQNTTINTGTSKTLTVNGSSTYTYFDATGSVGIGTATPTNALDIKGINPLRFEGVQTGYGNTLVVDASGVVKQLPASSTFHYSVCNTAGASISQNNQTGPVPYAQGSSPAGSIPGGGSWTAIPGLTRTISIGSGTNTVSFNCEGVTQYDGTLNTNSFVSYSIGIFIDGTLQASRSFTMVGAGSVAQFDTWQTSGQMMNMTAGTHTFAVYVTRRNSNSAANDNLYFCGAIPTSTATNTNAFMNRGVLFINGSY